MSELTKVSRRLVAVFAADVEGYSRLMGADEVGTLKGLTERRAIPDRLIGEHRDRIANTAGDSVLAEFGSAVDAVQCAVEAQTALAEANSSQAPDRRSATALPSLFGGAFHLFRHHSRVCAYPLRAS
jgi:adenylate cyclase